MSFAIIDFFGKATALYLMANFYASIMDRKYKKTLVIIIYVLLANLYYYFIKPMVYNLGVFSGIINLVIVVGFHLLFPFIFSKDNIKRNIINCIIFVVTLIFHELILLTMFYLIKGYIPTPNINDITTFVMNLIFNACYFLFSTMILAFIQIKRKQIENKSVIFTVIVPFIQVVLMVVLFLSYIEGVNSRMIFFGEIALITFILTDYVAYKIIQRNLDNYELKKQLEMAKLKNEYNYSYYELATNKFEEIARIKHDINNQLQSIYALLDYSKEKNEEMAMKMIDDLKDSTGEINNIKYCSNPIVNTVLILKSQIAKEKNIKTYIQVGKIKELNMKEVDLCSILSNLCDNSIEACEKMDNKDKFINIKIDKKGGYFIIKFINSCCENIKYNEKDGIITSKEDKKNHGYGLENIKSIVKIYDGYLKIKSEDNRFEICIIIPQG